MMTMNLPGNFLPIEDDDAAYPPTPPFYGSSAAMLQQARSVRQPVSFVRELPISQLENKLSTPEGKRALLVALGMAEPKAEGAFESVATSEQAAGPREVQTVPTPPEYPPLPTVPPLRTAGGSSKSQSEKNTAIKQSEKELFDYAEKTQRAGEIAALAKEDYANRKREIQEQAYVEERALAKRVDDEVMRRISEYDIHREELAKKQVDPEQYQKSLTGGQRFANFLAIALGGIGQAFGGGRNNALDMINADIERNIIAQEKNIDNGRRGLEAEQNQLAQYVKIMGDRQAAKKALRADLLEEAQSRLDMFLARNEQQLVQANGAQLRAGIQEKVASNRKEMIADTRSAAAAQIAAQDKRFQQELQLYNAGIQNKEIDARVQIAGQQNAAARQKSVADRAWQYGEALEKSKLPQAMIQLAALDKALKSGHGDIPGIGVWDSKKPEWMLSDDGRRVRTLVRVNIIKPIHDNAGSAISEYEAKLLNAAFSDTGTEDQVKNSIDILRIGTDAALENFRSAAGRDAVEWYEKNRPAKRSSNPPSAKRYGQ